MKAYLTNGPAQGTLVPLDVEAERTGEIRVAVIYEGATRVAVYRAHQRGLPGEWNYTHVGYIREEVVPQ